MSGESGDNNVQEDENMKNHLDCFDGSKRVASKSTTSTVNTTNILDNAVDVLVANWNAHSDVVCKKAPVRQCWDGERYNITFDWTAPVVNVADVNHARETVEKYRNKLMNAERNLESAQKRLRKSDE